ncbi:MAG: formate/nitrite transporter family protein [Deltaproteobacteria bacterium]|nr:formate/nitrite transporter family protein [Deltaproteobacteria bacterium]
MPTHPADYASESISDHDAYAPREIARRVEALGVAKARADTTTLLVLAILAGAFISLGALFFTVVVTKASLGFGINRLVGGAAFSLGLILVAIGGGELFTGNNLIAMAWASGRIGLRELLRNWTLVYAGNVLGCLGTVALVVFANIDALGGGDVGATAIQIAKGKAALGFGEAFARGILCNAFVCLAVWLAMSARSTTDMILAIMPPITAFVAIGLEHSIANWFFLPYGIALAASSAFPAADVARNLVAVTAGNIVGGTLLVAGVYWLAYLRGDRVDRALSS